MASSFDNRAAKYVGARPKYPSKWFSMLAALTPNHSLAWDVGTGNGQAAIGLGEYFEQVIATDISEEQIKHGIPHPKVKYFHTPSSMSDDELVVLLGGENSVDLITVAVALHWFDLENFYSFVNRLLRKPSGILAVWTYNGIQVNPEFDALKKSLWEKLDPFRNSKTNCALQGYKTLPFPFEAVGVGCEGQPLELDMPKEMSFEEVLRLMETASTVNIAKDQGLNFLSEDVVKQLKNAWGGSDLVRIVNFKTYMLAGKSQDLI